MAAVLKLVPGLVGRVETVLQVISKVKPLLAIVKMEMRYVMVILLLLLRLVSSGQKRIIARQDKLFWSIRKMDCNVKTIKTIPIVKIMKYDFAAQVSLFNSLSEGFDNNFFQAMFALKINTTVTLMLIAQQLIRMLTASLVLAKVDTLTRHIKPTVNCVMTKGTDFQK